MESQIFSLASLQYSFATTFTCKGSRASWGWSSLFEGKEALKKDLCWKIGNGLNVKIWDDNWIPSMPDDINQCTSVEERKAILNHQVADSLVWAPANDGCYKVKKGYHLFKEDVKVESLCKPSCSFQEGVRRIDDCWLNILCSGDFDEVTTAHLTFMRWNIRKDRCKWVFEKVAVDPDYTILKSLRAAEEFRGVASFDGSKAPIPRSNIITKWSFPGSGKIKINCDGAFKGLEEGSGIGIILRDHNGLVLYGCSRNVVADYALMEAINLAVDLELKGAIFESDCAVLVDAVKEKNMQCLWQCAGILDCILQGWSRLSNPSLVRNELTRTGGGPEKIWGFLALWRLDVDEEEGSAVI
ncbi:reverse transcriptase [Senna tora]|uniref:Reverse transcriptase n=1 Tax=Senna tora TaxID=362788 RepID=A0A834WBP4_9FABA|nr:reverse transcriptase [Senna tora]